MITLNPSASLVKPQTFINQSPSRDNPDGYFSILPREIIEHIFSFIPPNKGDPRLFVVCKLFEDIAKYCYRIEHQIWIKKACLDGRIEIVKKLLKNPYVDPSIDDNYPIIYSSLRGYDKIIVELLKDSRVNPAAQNNFAIQGASANAHMEVVSVLLKDSRVDPSANGNYAIRIATVYNNISVKEELLKDPRVTPHPGDELLDISMLMS